MRPDLGRERDAAGVRHMLDPHTGVTSGPWFQEAMTALLSLPPVPVIFAARLFVGTDPILIIDDHPDSGQPFFKPDGRILEDGSGLDRAGGARRPRDTSTGADF